MAIRKPAPLRIPRFEPLTVEDWYALPEDDPNRYELYEGMLVMAPPPDGRHFSISSWLHGVLHNYARAHAGRAFHAPAGVALSRDTGFEPDVVYLSQERMGRFGARGIEGAPDLVVEVASPSTRRYDVNTKLPAYLAAGVREVWIVDPVAKTVTVHSEGGAAPVTVAFGEPIPSRVVDIGNADLDRLPPLPD
ncbi:MAG: Uma2 family endonuclease [Chloroflexi bacterium]|nr:Uma2 family endonuclease [Chloroflexota bacterium]